MAVNSTTFSERFLAETISLLREMDADQIESVARGLLMVRDQGGRLFVLGVGPAAGQAGHVVNSFRSICNFEAYALTENLTEPNPRLENGGQDTSLSNWLVGSITLLMRNPYMSIPVRAWNDRAVASLTTFDIA